MASDIKLSPEQIAAIVQAVVAELGKTVKAPPTVELTQDAPGLKEWKTATWIEISLHTPTAKAKMARAVELTWEVTMEAWVPKVQHWFRYLKPNFFKFDVQYHQGRIEDVYMGTGLVWPTFSEREMYKDANSILFVVRRMMEYAQDPEVFLDTDPAFGWGLADLLDAPKHVAKLHEAYALVGEAYWECLDHNSLYLQTDHINNFDGAGLAQVKDKVLDVVEKMCDYSLLRHFQDKVGYSRNPEGIDVWLGAMEA